MSVTYGFYNSKNKDRTYDAIQMSSIFDGIIRDGILQHVGGRMMVNEASGMTIHVGSGRAWFNHTWTLNDSILPLEVPESDLILRRIDAVVLEVDARENERKNTIKIVKGTPSSAPSKPSMIKTNDRWQYPLAYISLNPGVTAIRQADITNAVGTSECPFVTAPLEKMSIDELVKQWQDQWMRLYTTATVNIDNAYMKWEQKWQEWNNNFTSEMSEWKQTSKSDFELWISQLQDILSEDIASNLANQIIELQRRVTELGFSEMGAIETLASGNKLLVNTQDGNKAIEAEDFLFAILDLSATAEIRRTMFRGKNLGTSFNGSQKANIANGTFKGFFLGDYWKINGLTWRIVDFDYWLGTGFESKLTKHHLVIMPDEVSSGTPMYYSRDTSKGYGNSILHDPSRESVMGSLKENILQTFGYTSVLSYYDLLVTETSDGVPTFTPEMKCRIEIPSEYMITGRYTYSHAREHDGYDNGQFALFHMSQPFIAKSINRPYWLRDTWSKDEYACVYPRGSVYLVYANDNQPGVRPFFLLG